MHSREFKYDFVRFVAMTWVIGFASILEHWLLTLVTLVLCLILAWLLDLLLIRPAQRVFDILVKKIGA